MLISETIDLGLQLVRLLLFYHFHIPLCDFLNLAQAWVWEPVPIEANVYQSGVFIQGFQQDRFHILREEVVWQLHIINVFVVLECINQINETCVIQSAAREVEFLKLSLMLRVWNDVRKVS